MPEQEEHSTEKLEKIMGLIRKMLTRADHPNTPGPEADLCRSRAEKYMHDYRIEESMLASKETSPLHALVPIHREAPICPAGSPYRQVYIALMSYCVSHVGAKMAYATMVDDDGVFMYTAVMTGYDSDLRYAEFLYQSARTIFGDRMEPKKIESLSDQENVYRMRSAGMERIRVAEIMGWVKGGAKVTRLYKAACAERGEEPVLTGQGVDVRVFRDQYADGFKNQFWSRLYHAKNSVDTSGTELVLAGRQDAVLEAFYTAHPHLRPDPAALTKTSTKPSKPKKWTKADQRQYERSYSRAGQAGTDAGANAAREVDINRGGTERLES